MLNMFRSGNRKGKVKSSIGILYIYDFDNTGRNLILNTEKNGLADYDIAFNNFVKCTCYTKSSVNKDKLKPSKPILKNKEVNLLTTKDKREIIKVYITHTLPKIDPTTILNSESILVDFIKYIQKKSKPAKERINDVLEQGQENINIVTEGLISSIDAKNKLHEALLEKARKDEMNHVAIQNMAAETKLIAYNTETISQHTDEIAKLSKKSRWQTTGVILALLIGLGSLFFDYIGSPFNKSEDITNQQTEVLIKNKTEGINICKPLPIYRNNWVTDLLNGKCLMLKVY